jgi:putative SOS response-associated peptidase YedK
MCGRLSLTDVTPEILTAIFSLDQVPEGVDAPGTDVRPTDTVLAVTGERPRVISAFRWGLVPFWAKDLKMGAKMINARAETLAEKLAFREAFRERRCLVVVDGWYEWQDVGAPKKQPWKFSRFDGAPFGFAGLWETWIGPEGVPCRSCTIITIAANRPSHRFTIACRSSFPARRTTAGSTRRRSTCRPSCRCSRRGPLRRSGPRRSTRSDEGAHFDTRLRARRRGARAGGDAIGRASG